MVESNEEHMEHTTQKEKVETSTAHNNLVAVIVEWKSVSPVKTLRMNYNSEIMLQSEE
jgi:hypothetical protein